MVATGIRLPNIRRMFRPDPGYTIVDADLSGADAQVVAWEAGCETLKTAFRSGAKIHVFNARMMWSHETRNMTDEEISDGPGKSKFYKPVKIGGHATNYGASPNALVANAGWTMRFAQDFQERWFTAYPEIKEWHERYERHLQGTECWNCRTLAEYLNRPCQECGKPLGGTVRNAFGFRRRYFERPDGILPEALAWTPQSSVAIVTEVGWTNVSGGYSFACQFAHAERKVLRWKEWLVCPEALEKWGHLVQFLLQVHDSIVFQIPTNKEHLIPEVVDDLRVIVPYPDPLIIPMGWKSSRVSWGDCKKQ